MLCGNVAGKTLTEEDLLFTIENLLTPESNLKFPYFSKKTGNSIEKRHASHEHLQNFQWLCFSNLKSAHFCKYCTLFKPNTQLSKSGSFLKKFELEGFTDFAKTDKLKEHEKSIYH